MATSPKPPASGPAALSVRKDMVDISWWVKACLAYSSRQANSSPSTTTPPVKVIVGKGAAEQTFYASDALLIRHSEFFAAALRGNWRENEDHEVRLPESDAESFGVFASFLYTGKVHVVKDDLDEASNTNPEWQRLGLCWILGDILLSASFQDAVLDATVENLVSTSTAPVELHAAVYDRTNGDNGLRRLMVDIAIFGWDKEDLLIATTHPALLEFYRDVAIRYKDLFGSEGERGLPWLEHPFARYRQHGADKPCYRTMTFP